MPEIHKLIHAVNDINIKVYLNILNLNIQMLNKVNKYREMIENELIVYD